MISVCIATYNGEAFIHAQLESILSQLHDDDEIIISDDGSTDNTLVGHRVYDGWDGQKWLDIVLHNYAAFDDDIKLACAVKWCRSYLRQTLPHRRLPDT